MVELERQGVRTEKRRRHLVEFLTAVGAIAVAFFLWGGVIALIQ